MQDLQGFLKFIQLVNNFQKVKRRVLIQQEELWENDVEHSYQLALAAWYIVSTNQLPFDLSLVIKYGLIHDLVEVYAGDTYIYEKDLSILNSKVERELAAQKRIAEEFPAFGDLNELIEKYESRQDQESKFVYALDKILPMINIYLDEGRTWRKEEVTLQMLVDNKKEKVALSPEAKTYFDDLISLLEPYQETLFGAKTYSSNK